MHSPFIVDMQRLEQVASTPLEHDLLECGTRGAAHLANWIKRVRASNPHPKESTAFMAWYHASQCTLPVLAVYALSIARAEPDIQKITFVLPATACLAAVFNAMFPDVEISLQMSPNQNNNEPIVIEENVPIIVCTTSEICTEGHENAFVGCVVNILNRTKLSTGETPDVLLCHEMFLRPPLIYPCHSIVVQAVWVATWICMQTPAPVNSPTSIAGIIRHHINDQTNTQHVWAEQQVIGTQYPLSHIRTPIGLHHFGLSSKPPTPRPDPSSLRVCYYLFALGGPCLSTKLNVLVDNVSAIQSQFPYSPVDVVLNCYEEGCGERAKRRLVDGVPGVGEIFIHTRPGTVLSQLWMVNPINNSLEDKYDELVLMLDDVCIDHANIAEMCNLRDQHIWHLISPTVVNGCWQTIIGPRRDRRMICATAVELFMYVMRPTVFLHYCTINHDPNCGMWGVDMALGCCGIIAGVFTGAQVTHLYRNSNENRAMSQMLQYFVDIGISNSAELWSYRSLVRMLSSCEV